MLRQIVDTFTKQDGKVGKTSLFYGLFVVVTILIVLTVCVVTVVFAINGQLTFDKTKELMTVAGIPSVITTLIGLLYNSERKAKNGHGVSVTNVSNTSESSGT